jgi:hypothetical protein
MEALLCLIKRINPQKMNISKSENMLIHLVFTHFIRKPNNSHVLYEFYKTPFCARVF